MERLFDHKCMYAIAIFAADNCDQKTILMKVQG